MIVGAAIVLADGLTRAADPGLELAPPQPLEYVPYHAAFWLAGLAFPLMMAYARKAQISVSEGLFLWFVFCTTAYTKDFSYLRWPGAPLFITDLTLVALLFSIYIVQRPVPHRRVVLDIALALFVAAGTLAAARGFLDQRNLFFVLRDSALVVYSLFFLVGYHLGKSWLAIKRLAVWIALGTALSVLNGMAWLFVAPEQRRFLAIGIYISISLAGVLILMANRQIRPQAGWILAGIFFFGLLLANARSLFVSLVIVLLVVLLAPGMPRRQLCSGRAVTHLLTGALLVCLFTFLFLQLQAGRSFATRAANDLASGVLHTTDDPYWQFRLMAWKEAWKRFKEQPLIGEGFGRPFTFEIWDNDPRPHNTFLTVLCKMGLVGLLPLLAFLSYFFWLSLQALHRNSNHHRISFLQVVILAQVSFCVYGGANLLLESPFLASLFWAGTGISLRMIHKCDSERLLRTRSQCHKSATVHGGLRVGLGCTGH